MGTHTSVGEKECLCVVPLRIQPKTSSWLLFPSPASLLVEQTGGRGRSPQQPCWLGFTDAGCFSVLIFTVSLY